MSERRKVRTGSARARAAHRRENARAVSREEIYKQEKETVEYDEEVEFPPGVEPAFVRVSAGGTYNLGDFNSLRLDVSISLPCLPSDVQKAYEFGSDFVAEKLSEQEAAWLGASNRKTRKATKR